MRIYENILDQLDAKESSASNTLASNATRHPRTPEYFSLYIKIQMLKISMRSVNRPKLNQTVEHLYDILDSMPYIDDYSDIILTNPKDENFTILNRDPIYQNDDDSFYVDDEVNTGNTYAYACFAIKPDFRKFTDVANFITSITTLFHSYMGAQQCIEYVFPSKEHPGEWKGYDSDNPFSDDNTPLIMDTLNNFWVTYKYHLHNRGTDPIRIWSAGHYASIIVGHLMPVEYRQQAYTDMFKYLSLYDILEYKYHGFEISSIKNYSPDQQSFGFMNNIASQMMKSTINLKSLENRNPRFLKFFLQSPYCSDYERVNVHTLHKKTSREIFDNIIFYNRNYNLKPQKIYFTIKSVDYPSVLYMDIYLGVVDAYIGEYNQLCISYPFFLHYEDSIEYYIDWLIEEIKELTDVVVDDSTRKTFIKFIEDNRIKNN